MEKSEPTSQEKPQQGLGFNPLRAVTIQIGEKRLRLKVVTAPPKLDSSQDDNDDDGEDLDDLLAEANKEGSTVTDDHSFVCEQCGQGFNTKAKLTRHEIEHSGNKPFLCNYCGKGFTHKQSLIMHERMHTGEKPYQCPICTKSFARQTNYNIHMKLHASGKRYFCSFCGKWYRTEHEMLDHQQTCLAQMHGQPVTTDRPLRYQCSYCDKMFHHRRDKNIHERTHTGERPYTCGYCGKGFTQSQALTIHIRTHTGERPYACGICGKDFRDSSALRKHEFVKHSSAAGTTPDELGGPGGDSFGSMPNNKDSILVSAEQLDNMVGMMGP